MMGRVSENDTGIVAYDLALPLMPGDPGYPVTPRASPLLERAERGVRPRYVPGPQPEGTVRVVLDSAGCNGEPATFRLYEAYPTLARPSEVFDVPQEQYERWEAALSAFLAMEDEIEALIGARGPVPPPDSLPDPVPELARRERP